MKSNGFAFVGECVIRADRRWGQLWRRNRRGDLFLAQGQGGGAAFCGARHSRFRVKPDAGISNEVADSLAKARFVSIHPDDLAREAGLPDGTVLDREVRNATYYRLAEDGEQGVELAAIRLRAWRIRYVGETDGYRVEPLGEPVERGQW